MIALGLNWWQAWLAVTFGYSIAAGFLVLNAIPGARHHIVFAAFARSAFGPVGSYWPVFQRAGESTRNDGTLLTSSAMACVWYGVQSWLGGTAVYIFLLAIFPSLGSIPNGIPASGTDTGHFIGFFLFSAISLVPLYFPLHQIRHLFTLKAIVAPAAGLGLFGWAIAKAGGVGELRRIKSSQADPSRTHLCTACHRLGLGTRLGVCLLHDERDRKHGDSVSSEFFAKAS